MVVNEGRVMPIGYFPLHFFGSLFIAPFHLVADPSFFAFSIICLATCSPSFQPASVSLGNCTPASMRDCEAARAICKMESALAGKKYARTYAAADAVTECSQ